jgi:hypothetical protein
LEANPGSGILHGSDSLYSNSGFGQFRIQVNGSVKRVFSFAGAGIRLNRVAFASSDIALAGRKPRCSTSGVIDAVKKDS